MDAHGAMLASLGKLAVARRVDMGRLDEVDDLALAPVVEWAAATRSPAAAIVRDPPFGESEALELIATAVLFHYINRPVSVFLDESPLPSRRSLVLPDAALPADMAWAAGVPHVAGAVVWSALAAARRVGSWLSKPRPFDIPVDFPAARSS